MLKAEHVWQAEQYHNHSSVQYNAAHALLSQLNFKKDSKVLDVGCGDGKITAEIAKHTPNGEVLGIDKSPEMIAFARKCYPNKTQLNLHFRLQDAQNLLVAETYDIIFSCFALQWVSDKYSFFQKASQCLLETGKLAITVPLNVSSALDLAIEKVTTSPRWKGYFDDFSPGWYVVEADEYKTLLARCKFSIKQFKITPLDIIFPSKKHFKDYVLPWFSYAYHLREALREEFFDTIFNEYSHCEPCENNGAVHLRFRRLDIIAEKSDIRLH